MRKHSTLGDFCKRFIVDKSGDVADMTKDLKDWPYGEDPKNPNNEALKLKALSIQDRLWITLSESVASLTKGSEATESDAVTFGFHFPPECKYREIAHEKIYRFLEMKYNTDKSWINDTEAIECFKRVVIWSNGLPSIPIKELKEDASKLIAMKTQFKTTTFFDKLKDLVEAEKAYDSELSFLASFRVRAENNENATAVKKPDVDAVKNFLMLFGEMEEDAVDLKDVVSEVCKNWNSENYPDLEKKLRISRTIIAEDLEKISDAQLKLCVERILKNLLPKVIKKYNAKSAFDKMKTEDIATRPDYEKALLSQITTDVQGIELPFNEGFGLILNAIARVQLQSPQPFVENASKSSGRKVTFQEVLARSRGSEASQGTGKSKKLKLPEALGQPEKDSGEYVSESSSIKPKKDATGSESQVAILKEQLQSIIKENLRLDRLNKDLNAEIMRLSKALEKLNLERAQWEAKFNTLNSENNALKLSRDEANAKNKALQDEFDRLNAENKRLEAALKSRPTISAGSGTSIIRTNDSADRALKDELSQTSASLGAKDRELHQKDEEILSLQGRIADSQQKLREAEEKLNSKNQPPWGESSEDLLSERRLLEEMRQEVDEKYNQLSVQKAELDKRSHALDKREQVVKAKENNLATTSKQDRSGKHTEKIVPKDIHLGGETSMPEKAKDTSQKLGDSKKMNGNANASKEMTQVINPDNASKAMLKSNVSKGIPQDIDPGNKSRVNNRTKRLRMLKQNRQQKTIPVGSN